MLNPNNTFFVGPIALAAHTSLGTITVGEVAVVNPVTMAPIDIMTAGTTISNMQAASGGAAPHTWRGLMLGQKISPATVGKATAAGAFRFTPVLGNRNIPIYSDGTNLDYKYEAEIVGATYTATTPPVACKVTLPMPNGGDGTAIMGVKVIYKDIRDLSPSTKYVTYTQEVPAKESNVKVAKKFADQINDLTNQKGQLTNFVATSAGGVLTLTAINPTYDVNQRYEYTRVDFEASVGYYYPGRALDGRFFPVDDLAAPTLIRNNYGVGYGPVVMDEEKRHQARLGITNWTQFPVQMPALYTDITKTYDKFTCDVKKTYRSADDIVDVKTAERLIIYVDSTLANAVSNLKAALGII